MKQFFCLTFLAGCLIMCFAFSPETYTDTYKEKGSVYATVNSRNFEFRQKDFYRALLLKKSNPLAFSAEAKNRTVASITFFGNDTTSIDNSPFSENFNMEYNFNPTSIGEIPNSSFELHYELNDYYILPDESHWIVTKMNWSPDKSYFLLTGEFECKLRKQGFPVDEQPVVTLKGNLHEINVSVPPWLISKIAAEQAENN